MIIHDDLIQFTEHTDNKNTCVMHDVSRADAYLKKINFKIENLKWYSIRNGNLFNIFKQAVGGQESYRPSALVL